MVLRDGGRDARVGRGLRTTCAAIACVLCAGCDGTTSLGGDAGPDGSTDSATDPDTSGDVPDTTDTAGDALVEPEFPPCSDRPACEFAPEDGVLGGACNTEMDCDVSTSFCLVEDLEIFDGEAYITNPGGVCALVGMGGHTCDPDDTGSCPDGSMCLLAGYNMFGRVSLFMDICSPEDDEGDFLDYNCGCRRGYRCEISMGFCVSGCSNDRECCETWRDENEDWQRDPEEVTLWPECTNWCDGDDLEEWEDDCRASFACVNEGTPGAMFGDPCEHDSHCPVNGRCWNWIDPDTDEEMIPGGYCTREGCQWEGRSCEDGGGACLYSGPFERFMGNCMRPCFVGLDPSDPEFGCRTTEGEEQACYPTYSMGWIGGPPEGGEDGFCFPGNYPGGDGAIGEPCSEDEDCVSPLGLGMCNDWFGDTTMCSIRCNEMLAEERAICGEADTDGIATGLCGWSMCLAGCMTPGAALGANDCPRDDLACAPLSSLGTSNHVAEGALRPPGYCMPACDEDEFCEDYYGEGSTCDPLTGICS